MLDTELISTIQKLQRDFSEKVITRDFFRAQTGIYDSHWIKHFGTFPEFRRQAGLEDTRQVSRILGQKAHAVEANRLFKLGQERKTWSDLYSFPIPNERFHSLVVLSDIHDDQCDPFFRRMSLQAVEDLQPHKIIFNGDLIDNAEISKYGKRTYDPLSKMKWIHNYLSDLRDASPNSGMILVEGNHEYRLVAHLTEKSPYVMDMLNFNNIDIMRFLGLHEFKMNYYARADFSTFTETDIKNELCRNYYQHGDFVLLHHFPQGRNFGMPGCSGHHHKFRSWNEFNKTYGSYSWYQTGGGSRRHVDYHVSMGEEWNNGFMIIIVDMWDRKNTIFNYVDCTGDHCFLNGTLYSRTEEESIFRA